MLCTRAIPRKICNNSKEKCYGSRICMQHVINNYSKSKSRNHILVPSLSFHAQEFEIAKEFSSQAESVGEFLSNIYDNVDYAQALALADDSTSDFDDTSEQFIYGEFDMPFFLALLARFPSSPSASFADLGSGRGQLVHLAALTWNWSRCVGVEIMPILHQLACAANQEICNDNEKKLSPCTFLQLNFLEDMEPLIGIDFVFIYATKMPTQSTLDGETLTLSTPLHAALQPGAIVITINRQLDCHVGFRLLEELQGPNPEDFLNPSMAFVYEVVL